jgi:hypothetical protein
VEPVHLLLLDRAAFLLGTGNVLGFPTEPALLAKDRECAKGIAAMERNRVVEDMENPHV